jgi:uncharacterized membrane protein YhhN
MREGMTSHTATTGQQLAAAVTCLAVVALLIAERAKSRKGVWLFKPLASAAFLALAALGNAPWTPYRAALGIGLALCAFGDVLLIPAERQRWFLAGIASFALGHVAYAAGFALHGVALVPSAVALAGMAAVVAITLRWLGPHLPTDMRIPVRVYMMVIGVMLACAVGASVATRDAWPAIGAIAFAASDLSVARDRFVRASFLNVLWGLPLYYGAQVILAIVSAG